MATTEEPRPTLVSAAPRFLVEDMDETLTFYGRLGFETTYREGALRSSSATGWRSTSTPPMAP
jgi:hypothetical protein